MPMTPIRFTSLLLLLVLTLAGGAHAQSSSSSKGLVWPRTTTGQPDFAFARDEAYQDAMVDAKQDGDAPPSMPTLQILLADETPLDPLHLAAGPSDVSTTSLFGADDPSATGRPVSLMDKLLANVVELPVYKTAEKKDASEFKISLIQAISSTIANWRPQAERYNFSGMVRGLTLQAIVTSPQRYAIINGQRYMEGESFQLKAPINVPDLEIMAAMDAKMPAKDSVTPDLYGQYQTVYDETLAAFIAARNANPAVGRQHLTLPVNVKKIEARRVQLSVNGEPHELAIKFAY